MRSWNFPLGLSQMMIRMTPIWMHLKSFLLPHMCLHQYLDVTAVNLANLFGRLRCMYQVRWPSSDVQVASSVDFVKSSVSISTLSTLLLHLLYGQSEYPNCKHNFFFKLVGQHKLRCKITIIVCYHHLRRTEQAYRSTGVFVDWETRSYFGIQVRQEQTAFFSLHNLILFSVDGSNVIQQKETARTESYFIVVDRRNIRTGIFFYLELHSEFILQIILPA